MGWVPFTSARTCRQRGTIHLRITSSCSRGGGARRNFLNLPFGKNELVMRVVWALVIAIAGLVITKVLDPVAAQQVVEVMMMGAP